MPNVASATSKGTLITEVSQLKTIAVSTKLVTPTSPSARQCRGEIRSSVEEFRISLPLISVRATPAISQTKSSETITAGWVTLTIARVNGIWASKGGEATRAVTAVAAIARKRTTVLRIDPPRCPTQQKHQRCIHQKEKSAESDLPKYGCVPDGIGGSEDRGARAGTGVETDRQGAQRRNADRSAECQGDHKDCQSASEHQRPGTIRSAFPRRERQCHHVDRGIGHRRIQLIEESAAFGALGEMRGVRFGIFEKAAAAIVHSGSTNSPSASFKRLRARNSLFLTVPSGNFFIVAISSYESSAKCRNWISSR